MEKLNTHFYDGNLKERLEKIKPELDRVQQKSREEKATMYLNVLHRIREPQARANLMALIRDFTTNANSNFDTSNSFSADDLMCIIAEKLDWEDTLAMLETQLVEMSSGMCPQGRTHRLFQIVGYILD